MLVSKNTVEVLSSSYSTPKLNRLLKNRRNTPLRAIRFLLEQGVEPSPFSLHLALNTNEEVLDLVLSFWLTINREPIPDYMNENANYIVVLTDECKQKLESARGRLKDCS